MRRFFVECFREGGLGASSFTFTAGTVGAGFLSLPYAYALCGYVQATILLVLFGCFTVYSIRLLGIAERRTGLSTFEGLARHLLGPCWDRFVRFVMITFNWGTTVAYIIALIKIFAPILEAKVDGRHETLRGFWGSRLITLAI